MTRPCKVGVQLPEVERTGRPLDVVVTRGLVDVMSDEASPTRDYMALQAADGSPRYSLLCAFRTDAAHMLATEQGLRTQVLLQVPEDAAEVRIEVDGLVRVRREGGAGLDFSAIIGDIRARSGRVD